MNGKDIGFSRVADKFDDDGVHSSGCCGMRLIVLSTSTAPLLP
jgi:hypothetical protein